MPVPVKRASTGIGASATACSIPARKPGGFRYAQAGR
nr:MAG TPA: hypothetical protein [Caudoviricetes sp.]